MERVAKTKVACGGDAVELHKNEKRIVGLWSTLLRCAKTKKNGLWATLVRCSKTKRGYTIEGHRHEK